MTLLDASLQLEPNGEGQWRAHADPKCEANTGMFGGWTAALLLKAAVSDARAQGSPAAITVNYVNRIAPSSALALTSQPISGGRSLSHWRCEVRAADSDEVAAAATIVLANRRESDRFTEEKMPEAPPPEAFPTFHPPGTFGQTLDLRFAIGATPFGQPTTRSLAWQRETGGKHLDEVLLTYMCDVGWPRVWAIGTSPRPSSTITMSVYILATPAEIAACADDFMLSDMIATRVEHSIVGSQAKIWSRGGTLLATTQQLCWFR